MIERESGVRVETVQDYLEEQELSELVSLDPLSQSKIKEMLSATGHLTVKRGIIQYDPHTLRTVHDSAGRRLHLLRVLQHERRRPAEESSIPPEHLRDEIRDLMFRCVEKTDVDLRGRCASLTDEDRVCSHVLLHLALGERKRFLGLLALVSAGGDRPKKDLHEVLTYVVADVPKKPDPLFRTAMELGFIEKQSNGLHVADLFDDTVAHGIATARETILGLRRGVLAPQRQPTRRTHTRLPQEQPASEPDVEKYGADEAAAILRRTVGEDVRMPEPPVIVETPQPQTQTELLAPTLIVPEAALPTQPVVEPAMIIVETSPPHAPPTLPIPVPPPRERYDSTWEYFDGLYGAHAPRRDRPNKSLAPANDNISRVVRPPYATPGELQLEKNSRKKKSKDAVPRTTKALPGTGEKLEELRRRDELGLPLWNTEDRLYYDEKE